ncbi:uncharacterized protein F5891DRAFT_1127780 [Suillus fuscotomentosus]|uniref:Uncharacterized protein n=1 Tax=Suillus fuscotomentosus TaxID=1912939 RepID=A0AAD4HLK6_9AGAM|nr:uncharacterized protein F5891DRAFT_1127780 [Suillus fuscotomentosus]KAG1902160.1 hypothetical protein F5891DRAFT_1127780 [Suillus fuscotomentosus]
MSASHIDTLLIHYRIQDKISKDPDTVGATFVPIILGSDKTTVSVGTGNNEYYPLYLSIGNVSKQYAIAVIGFLAMPKMHTEDPKFRKFRHQLFHSSLSKILQPLKPGMTKPEVAQMNPYNSHFRHVVYGLGPYIADYEEQVLLGCIVKHWCDWCARCLASHLNLDDDALDCCRKYVDALVEEGTLLEIWDDYGIVGDIVPFTNDFPCADINRLIAPDLLHQLIKGAFKDHLVDWVEKYLLLTHGKHEAQRIMDDIDRRYVYLPAIEGHLPQDNVRAFRALLEFCYLVRRNIITEKTLTEIQDVLARFHHYREAFRDAGVVPTFSLPHQHSLKHYIQLFGAPNSLCSLITESKHIKAVKEPWRCLSRFNALERQRAKTIAALAAELNITHLPNLLQQFLFEQKHPNDTRDISEVSEFHFPHYDGGISVFNSASSRFYSPSDLSGIGGMRTEYVRACRQWRNGHARNDCVFVSTKPELKGMQGFDIARVLCVFSFTFQGMTYPCAVIRWFDTVGDSPDEDTGMWIVRPAYRANHSLHMSIIHIDLIYRAAHLIPVYGAQFVSHDLKYYQSYDSFRAYYVNKYADHHAFEIAF